MNTFVAIIAIGLGATTSASAYEGPSPLTGIKISLSVTFNAAKGLYRYGYTITNPASNDGDVISVELGIANDPTTEVALPNQGFTQCAHFSRHASENNFQSSPMVPVGSAAPNGWSCSYALHAAVPGGSFSWGAIDDPYVLKPGKTVSGLVLVSAGLPGIRDALVTPDIDLQRLPSDYAQHPELLASLRAKVNWTGKTIGPKAPPKVFDATAFITNLIALKDRSETLGWIGTKGFENSLTEKLDHAKTDITACKIRAAKGTVDAFTDEVRAAWKEEEREEHGDKDRDKDRDGKDRRITPQGYALLFFNGKFLLTQLEKRTNLNCPVERDGDHDGDDGKKKDP